MPTIGTVLLPLSATAALTTSATVTMGAVNRYNASSGPLTPALPALSGLNVGATCIVEKDPLDASTNTITVSRAGADTFADGTTTVTLTASGMQRRLQVVSISGTKFWKKLDGFPGSASGSGTAVSLGNLGASYVLTSANAVGIAFGTLTANTAITLPAPTAGGAFTLVLKEDATGGRTPTFGGQTVDYPAGTIAWVTTANALNVVEFRAWDTSAWHIFPATSSLISSGGGGDASTNTATSVDSEIVLFSGTGGKTLKRATGSGIAKLTSGVLGVATSGTDYVAAVDASNVGPNWYQPGYISGQYYLCNSGAQVTTSASLSFATLRLSPWTVTQSITITRLFAEHTVLQTGTSFRIGIYNDDGTGRPGALVLDAGIIDTSVTPAVQEITVSKALTPGLYWVGGAVQGSGTQPTIRTISSNGVGVPMFLPLGTTLPVAGAVFAGWSQTGVSGALPGTLSSPSQSGLAIPRIGFKVA